MSKAKRAARLLRAGGDFQLHMDCIMPSDVPPEILEELYSITLACTHIGNPNCWLACSLAYLPTTAP